MMTNNTPEVERLLARLAGKPLVTIVRDDDGRTHLAIDTAVFNDLQRLTDALAARDSDAADLRS